MNPKRTYLIFLLVGLAELLLFLIISKNSPVALWESVEAFVLGGEYSLAVFFHSMLLIFLLIISLSYLFFAPKEESGAQSAHNPTVPSLLEEIDYAKEEEPEKMIPERELKNDAPQIDEKDPILKPPNKRKEHSPMFDSPPPGAPKRRPPDSNRKLL